MNIDNKENGGESVYKESEIKKIKPKNIEDAKIVADCLRETTPIIVNFEETETAEFKRVMDFISGTIYAINGSIKQVSPKVFVCAPNNVEVVSPDGNKKTW